MNYTSLTVQQMMGVGALGLLSMSHLTKQTYCQTIPQAPRSSDEGMKDNRF